MFEARAISLTQWQIFSHETGEFLLEVYKTEREAQVAAAYLSSGVMTPTRASYTRGAWQKVQKSAGAISYIYQAHQKHFPTPAEVAENVARSIHERSVVNRLLGEVFGG